MPRLCLGLCLAINREMKSAAAARESPAAVDPGLRSADARDAQHILSTAGLGIPVCVCVCVRACGRVAGPHGEISKLQVPLVTLPHGPPKNQCC